MVDAPSPRDHRPCGRSPRPHPAAGSKSWLRSRGGVSVDPRTDRHRVGRRGRPGRRRGRPTTSGRTHRGSVPAPHPAAVGSSRTLFGAWGSAHDRPAPIPSGDPPGRVASWCDDVARRVRSGTSLSQALVESVPGDADVRAATGRSASRSNAGDPSPTPCRTSDPTCRGNRHLATACSVIAVSARLGGASAAPLDRAAAALRLRAVDDEERRARRGAGAVVGACPDRDPGRDAGPAGDDRSGRPAVVVEPVGALCVATGLLLNATGWLWMRHTIGRRP